MERDGLVLRGLERDRVVVHRVERYWVERNVVEFDRLVVNRLERDLVERNVVERDLVELTV